MNSKKAIAGALSAILMAAAPAAFAQQADSSIVDRAREMAEAVKDSALEKLEKFSEEYKLELRAELAVLETVIKSIETTQFVNESLRLDHANVYVMVPATLLVGTEAAQIGTRVADAIVKSMTPEKAKWFAEYAELKAAQRTARLAYRQAVRDNSPDVKDLKIAMVEAEKAVTEKLLTKPGVIYRMGRFIRAAGRTSVVVGGMTMTAVTFNETLMLVIGRDEMQNHLNAFREKASKIEALLN